MDYAEVQCNEIIVDGIKILSRPKEENFSLISIDTDGGLFHGMEFNRNIPIWFDIGAVMTDELFDRKPRKNAVKMITCLLENSIPVYVGASANLHNFKDEWNEYCCREGAPAFLKAVWIPDGRYKWFNTDCIGLTNSLISGTQKHFMRGGVGEQHKNVIMIDPTKENEPNFGYVDVIITNNDPFVI